MNKERRILLITEQALYQLSLNLSVIVRVPLKDIRAMTLIRSSSAIMAIHVEGSFDYLLETVRRTELVIFLITSMDNKGLNRPGILYSSGLKVLQEAKEKVLNFDPSKTGMSKDSKQFLRTLQSNNFINSNCIGYLDKRSESFFKSWTEKFCVLTNVGMLYYNDP